MKKDVAKTLLEVVKFILTLGLSHITKWFNRNK